MGDLILFLPELVVLGGALVVLMWDLFLPHEKKPLLTWVSFVVALAALASTFVPEVAACATTARHPVGLDKHFAVDALSLFFKRAFAVTAAGVFLISRDYVKSLQQARGEFHTISLFALLGMFLCAGANDFMTLFVSLETVTISFFILTAIRRDRATSVEAGMKLLVIGSLSAGFLLYGIAFIYGSSGSIYFSDIAARLAPGAVNPLAARPELILGTVLLFIGLGFKTSAVPMHVWVPDVYQGAPTPITAYLSVGSKLAGFVLMVRALDLFAGSPAMSQPVTGLLAVLAALTLLFGNLGALPQTNLKRLMGYSSIAQCGYILVGLASSWALGIDGALFYMAAYVVMNLAAFAVIVVVSRATGSHEIDDYAGLGRRSPFLGMALTVALLSLAGVPPFMGFVGKFMLLGSAFGRADLFWLGVTGLVTVVIALFYYLRIVKRIWVFEERVKTPIEVPGRMRAFLAASVIVLFALAIVPQILSPTTRKVSDQLGFASNPPKPR